MELTSGGLVAVSTVALAFTTYQLARVSRFQGIAISLNVQAELLAKFDSEEMRSLRRQVSSRVLDPADTKDQADVQEILGVIEHIATAVRRHAIDRRSLWASSLGDVIFYYIETGREFIMVAQEGDATLYEDALWYQRKASGLTYRRQLSSKVSRVFRRRFLTCQSRHQSLIESTRKVERDLDIESPNGS
jgi:hypothetical protein